MDAESSSRSAGRRRRAPAGGPHAGPKGGTDTRAEPQPVDVDGVGAALAGTVAWAVALVAMLPFYGRLRDDGRDWWIWTCLAGVGLGLIGFEYCRRRRASLRHPAADAASDEPAAVSEAPTAEPEPPQGTQEPPSVGNEDEHPHGDHEPRRSSPREDNHGSG